MRNGSSKKDLFKGRHFEQEIMIPRALVRVTSHRTATWSR
jgi:hypothetical protein